MSASSESLAVNSTQTTPSRLLQRGMRRREVSVSILSSGIDPTPSQQGSGGKPESYANTVTIPLFMTQSNEDLLFLPVCTRNKRVLSQVTTRSSSASSCTESPFQRQLNSVRIKVGLAEAIVQNASITAKVPMAPEKRRRQMLQLEVAKLILFVARQHNIREELQQVAGNSLDVSDEIMYHRRSIESNISFLAREPPPDLSLKELKRATFEMEKHLEKMKDKKSNAPSVSAHGATSNLSEFLWLIESIELETLDPQDVYLGEEAASFIAPSTSANTSTPLEALQRQHELPQKKRPELFPPLLHSTPSLQNEGESFSTLLRSPGLYLMEYPPQLSTDKTTTKAEKETEEEELVGFSVDVESPGCRAVEAAGLKLLQFMYDAVDAKDKGLKLTNGSEEEIAAMLRAERTMQYGNEIMRSLNTDEADAAEPNECLLGSDGTMRNFDATRLTQSARNRATGTLSNAQEEELSNQSKTSSISALGEDSFFFSGHPAGFEPSLVNSWIRPVQSTVEVHPLRTGIIDILKRLYGDFNYKYYFEHCKPPKADKVPKTKEDYYQELERRVARRKSEKQQRIVSDQNEEDSMLLRWKGRSSSSKSLTVGKRDSNIKIQEEITDDQLESMATGTAETPPLETPSVVTAPPTETTVDTHGEGIVLVVELEEGIHFLLKGRRDERAGQQSVSGSMNSFKKGKELTKGGDIENKKAVSERGNTAQSESREPDFDSYTLYAVNQSDMPRQATVETNRTKLKNLKLKALLKYFGKKRNAIAVDLPPRGTQLVLVMKPIKKGRKVVFDEALKFYEGPPNEEAPKTTYAIAKQSPPQVQSTTTPPRSAPLAEPEVLRDSGGTGAEAQAKGESVSQTEYSENKTSTKAGKTSLEVADATEPSVHGNEEEDQGKAAALSGARVPSMQTFKPLLLRNTGGYTEDFSSEAYSFDGSSLSGNDVSAKGVNDWGVSVLPLGEDLEDQQEEGWRQKGDMGVPRKRPKESDNKAARTRFMGEKGTKRGSETRIGSSKGSQFEADRASGEATRVHQWGVPLTNDDDEAFENNCVVLSVLQASEWQSGSKVPRRSLGSKSAVHSVEGGEPKEMNVKDGGMDDATGKATEGGILMESSLRTTSERYPSARFRATSIDTKEEDIVTAALYPAGDGDALKTEEIVSSFLQRIAEAEQLNLEEQIDNEDISYPKGSEETPLPAGSAALWRRQLVSQSQQDPHSIGSQEESKQLLSSLTPGVETEFPLGSDREICKVQGSTSLAALRAESEEHEKGSTLRASSSHMFSSEQLTANATVVQRPSVTLEGGSSAQRMKIYGLPQSSVTMNESVTPVHLDENYTSTSYPQQPSVAAKVDGGEIGDDVSTPVETTSGLGTTSRTADKRSVSIEPLQGNRYASPTMERPAFNLDLLLKSVKKAEKKEAPLPGLSTRIVKDEYALPEQVMPASPSRQHAYAEARPDGRFAIFAPEEMNVKGAAHTSDRMDKKKMSTRLSGVVENAAVFAEEIRTTFHAFARQATSQWRQTFARSEIHGKATVGRNVSVDVMRHATLPALSMVYSPETAQDVEDMEAAEEEAKALFLQDPARYDCVIDELTKRAIARVYEEEEREKERRDSAAHGTAGRKLKEGLIVVPGRMQNRSVAFRQFSVVGSQMGGSQAMNISSTGSMVQLNGDPVHFTHGGSFLKGRHPSLLLGKSHRDKVRHDTKSELDQLLDEQRRAKKIVAYILMEMRRMWRRRCLESNLALRSAVDRFIKRSVLFSWHFERRRVLNLHKLIHLLDRKTGRVGGWLPFYMKDRVMEDRFVWEPAPLHLSRPLRVVHRAMCLARQQRMFPIRLVRQQAFRRKNSQHILYGYKRTIMEPFRSPAVRLRHGRRSRYAAPFQNPTMRFSPQVEWMDGTPKK
ncbi:hypothetical protein, conserved [Trypanosoma cruzi]|uniref:Uncharacterized protein n=1 Tax=Trypanosoma cruzi (strain CL Brener) TaxID=353153 RepID=Q4DXB8_TRYCC|nr:hypothetical protein, conserved [Trypanosoma cruzi]EAN97179.1 hypothetical protein, conserved [Trypanosoma cruzi]|eukprot:XP_819030.1 hypothetical protein [Trypanosoma cruzi strain CL Brener]